MSGPRDPRRETAVRLHAALMGGVVIGGLALALLRSKTAAAFGPRESFLLQCMALAFGASGFGAATVVRSRIPPIPTGGDEGAWWRQYLGRATLTWALIEGPALTGAVLYFLTGSWVPLLVSAMGLLLLFVNAPGRLAGR